MNDFLEKMLRRGYWNQAGADGSDAGGAGDGAGEGDGGTLGGGSADGAGDGAGDGGGAGNGDGDGSGTGDGDGGEGAAGDGGGEGAGDGKGGKGDGDGDDGDGEGDDDENKELFGKPEDGYKPTELAEGVEFDQAAFDKLVPIAERLNLSQKAVDELVTAHSEILNGEAEAASKALMDQEAGWLDTIKADEELGGDTSAEKLSVIKGALDAFAPGDTDYGKEFRQLMDHTRIGNHPAMVRFLKRVGDAVSADNFVPPGHVQGKGEKTTAEKLYPNSGDS